MRIGAIALILLAGCSHCPPPVEPAIITTPAPEIPKPIVLGCGVDPELLAPVVVPFDELKFDAPPPTTAKTAVSLCLTKDSQHSLQKFIGEMHRQILALQEHARACAKKP